MRSYRPAELFDASGALLPEIAAIAPAGVRRMSANPHANGGTLLRDLILPDFRDYAVDVPQPGRGARRGDARARRLSPRRDRGERRQLPHRRARRDRLEPADRGVREDDPRVAGRARGDRRGPRRRRTGHGGAVGAPLPGLARGLSADRAARPLQLLRGVHPHHRLDVQPAREVAQDLAAHPVADAARIAQLPAHLARVAAGSQRLLAPGSGLHRPRRQQEGRGHPRLPAARRELPAVGDGSLPAQPQLRQCGRRREGAGTDVSLDRRCHRALHARHRHLGVGFERRRSRAGRRDGVLRRRPHARDARGRRAPARAPAGSARARRQRRRPHAPAARQRAPARSVPMPSSMRSSRPTGP